MLMEHLLIHANGSVETKSVVERYRMEDEQWHCYDHLRLHWLVESDIGNQIKLFLRVRLRGGGVGGMQQSPPVKASKKGGLKRTGKGGFL